MSHGRNKYQSRESRLAVREIFMREWDPIGVRGVEQAQDEYDTYVAKAYVMLMDEHASKEAIAEYLFDIAANYMGLGRSEDLRERSERTAQILFEKRPDFETH